MVIFVTTHRYRGKSKQQKCAPPLLPYAPHTGICCNLQGENQLKPFLGGGGIRQPPLFEGKFISKKNTVA